MKTFKKYLINTILVLILISIIIIIFNFLKFEISKLILDYIKVLIWPGIVIYGIYEFKEDIKKLINNIKKTKLPGGFEFETEKEEINQNKDNVKDELNIDALNLDDLFGDDSQSLIESQQDKIIKELSFNKIYIYIYGSQIELLQDLKNTGTDGLNYIDVSAFFEKIKSSKDFIYPYNNTENWLSFIIDNKLIEEEFLDGTKYVKITLFGTEFIDYINEKEYLKWSETKNY